MMENENKDSEDFGHEEEKPVEELSGDEILSQIENDAADSVVSEQKNEGNDLLRKLGLSKNKGKKEHDETTRELLVEKQKNEELNDKFLRLFAEFDNFRKRTQKERIELFKTAGVEIINSLLPVVDDFQRALKQTETLADAMPEGIKLIYQKLLSILESKGLKAMKSLGEDFNPELHEAITEVAVEDAASKGKIMDEIESGYYLNDKIIRHAKVIVGK